MKMISLKTHSQKSITETPILELKPGQVIIFHDKDAKQDAREQLGIVYRIVSKERAPLSVAVFPFSAVSPQDYRRNPMRYNAGKDGNRMVLQPNSKNLTEMGVNANYYYTAGTAVKKGKTKSIVDRDRLRILPVTHETVALGNGRTVKVLGRVHVDVMGRLDDIMSRKFSMDRQTNEVMIADMRIAAATTMYFIREASKPQQEPLVKKDVPKDTKTSRDAFEKVKAESETILEKALKPVPPSFLRGNGFGF